MNIKRVFLGWDQPFIETVTAKLLQRTANKRPCDLSSYLVVVPTMEAGRLLRESLAAAMVHGGGLLSPQVVTPSQVLIRPAPDALTPTECLVLWMKVIEAVAPDDFSEVLPHASSHQHEELWRFSVAEHLQTLRRELNQEGKCLENVTQILGEQESAVRWQQLLELENLYLQEVENLHDGRPDPYQSQLEKALAPELPPGITHLVAAGVPDPIPLALMAWGNLPETCLVEIWINAPEAKAAGFDLWGRPVPEVWQQEIIPLPITRVRLLMKPSDQAAELSRLVKTAMPCGPIAVGVIDSEILPHAEELIERECGISVFNPGTCKITTHPVCRLASALLALYQEKSYIAAAALLRHSDVLDGFQRAVFIDNIARFLTQLDKVQNHHLPGNWHGLEEGALKYNVWGEPAKELAAACSHVRHWLAQMNGRAVIALPGLLRTIYDGQELADADDYARSFNDAATAVLDAISEVLTAGKLMGLSDSVQIKLFKRILDSGELYPENAGAEIDLSGWLELGWKVEPHLIIAGFNEERVTNTITSDPFLPDGAREKSGLTGNRQRFTRDLFLLTSLCQTRRHQGSVTVLLGKMSEQGDALKPSRLLFCCTDGELPERVKILFADRDQLPQTEKNNATMALKLFPRITAAPPVKIRVTGLSNYLQCPFRFYLTQILNMEPLNDRMMEIDERDFGSLCHQLLEQYGKEFEPGMKEAGMEKIAGFCQHELDRLFHDRFGDRPSAALLVQYEMLRLRMEYFAQAQFEEYQRGWRIWQVETKMELSWHDIYHSLYPNQPEEPWRKVMVSGKLDRLDRRDRNGVLEYRIIDYKTSGKTPAETHLKGKNTSEWIDLQLPLYAIMSRLKFSEELASIDLVPVAYFCLPDVMGETRIEPFNLSMEQMRDAVKKADEVIKKIIDGEFWPPTKNVKYDDFEELFTAAGAEALIDENWQQALKQTWQGARI